MDIHWSRSKQGIWLRVFAVLGISFLAGLFVPRYSDTANQWWANSIQTGADTDATNTVVSQLVGNPEELFNMVEVLRFARRELNHNPAFTEHLQPALSEFTQALGQQTEQKHLVRSALMALASPSNEPSQALLALTREDPPVPYSNWAAAVCYLNENPKAAVAYAQQEWLQHDDRYGARRLAVDAALAGNLSAELRTLLTDDRTKSAVDPSQRQHVAWLVEDYSTWFLEIGHNLYRYWQFDLALVASLAFITWTLTITLASRYPVPVWLPLAGLAMGILSIWPTLASYQLLHVAFPALDDTSTLLTATRKAVLSIGLREEVCKLLCVLPFMWFLRGKPPILWILTGSFVGLGFAWEENISYYSRGLGSAVAGRLLTANFLHLSLTAMTTYGLCLIVWHTKTHLEQGVRYLIFSVLIHGIYDAVLIVPEMGQLGGFLAIIVLALTAGWYLDLLQKLRNGSVPKAGPIGVLAVGLAATVGGAFIVLSHQNGPAHAADLLVPASLASVIYIAIFTNRLHEPLAD